ncbi:MAG: cysteine hydrolase [Scytolyngbya sp. HA4215-MV1]|jgi:nicotinamidase-related amidase|nr:cysteine hydrolase [Scytolyngbya sp. HA4215-MV1]
MNTDMYCYTHNRDKTPLPSIFDPWFEPERTAVLCIDMHRGHLEEECTCPAPRAIEKIEIHNTFHRQVRALGIPVVMVQHWQRHGGIDDIASRKRTKGANWRYVYELYMSPNPLMDQHSWEGTRWLDLMVETAPTDYYIRTKKRLSGFYPTDLEFLLHNLDVDNVILTGTFTDACVLSTAFDAANRDFRVIVPRDIVAGYSEEAEQAALLVISLHLGLVVDSDALIKEWQTRQGGNPVPENSVMMA